MKAFILTAGEGTRLRPLTYDQPKPMLKVVNKPVLHYIVQHLAQSGVKEIMMNPGYCGDQIEQFFGDGNQYNVSINYLPEMEHQNGKWVAKPKGSASTLAVAQHFYQFFDEPVLVLCGDALIDIDVQFAMQSHRASGAAASVFLQEVPADQAHKYGIAEVNDCGFIESFIEKPKFVRTKRCFANTGIYIFNPEVINSIQQFQGMDIGGDLLPRLLEQGKPIAGFFQPYNWLDIGTVEDYKRVNHLLNTQSIMQYGASGLKRSVNVGTSCRIEGTLANHVGQLTLGNGCIIKAQVKLSGDNIIGNNVIIGEHSQLHNCIIADYALIPAGSQLNNCILTPDWLLTFDHAGQLEKSIQLNAGNSRAFFTASNHIQPVKRIA